MSGLAGSAPTYGRSPGYGKKGKRKNQKQRPMHCTWAAVEGQDAFGFTGALGSGFWKGYRCWRRMPSGSGLPNTP